MPRNRFLEAPKHLPSPDSNDVFNFEFIESDADTDFYEFEFNVWDGHRFPGVKKRFGPIYLPDGIVKYYEDKAVLISDDFFEKYGRVEILLLDFAMTQHEKKPFVVRPSSWATTLELDTIIYRDSSFLYRFNVEGFANDNAEWVFYASKERGIEACYILCPFSEGPTVVSYVGEVPEKEIQLYFHIDTGECNSME